MMSAYVRCPATCGYLKQKNKVRTFQGDSRADTPVKPSRSGPDSVPSRALNFGVGYLRLRCRTGSLAAS